MKRYAEEPHLDDLQAVLTATGLTLEELSALSGVPPQVILGFAKGAGQMSAIERASVIGVLIASQRGSGPSDGDMVGPLIAIALLQEEVEHERRTELHELRTDTDSTH